MSDPYTWSAIIGAIGNIAGSALAPSPFQERQSFNNSLYENQNISPVVGIGRTQAGLRDLMGGMAARAREPVSLPDAVVGDVPGFSGGGLPMDIGVGATPERLKTPYTLPGIDLGNFEQDMGINGTPRKKVTDNPGGPDDTNETPPTDTGTGEPPPRWGGPPRTGGPNRNPGGDPPTRRDPSDPYGDRGPGGGGRTPGDVVGPSLPPGSGRPTGPLGFAQNNPQVYGALQLLMHAANPNGQGVM